MPARKNSAVSSTARPSRASKDKARPTIKVATVPKFKSRHLSEMVHKSPLRTPSPISHPVVTPMRGGELSDDESLWEGLPQSDQRLDHNSLMDGIEKMVRDTMSDVFASRDGKEGKFAT